MLLIPRTTTAGRTVSAECSARGNARSRHTFAYDGHMTRARRCGSTAVPTFDAFTSRLGKCSWSWHGFRRDKRVAAIAVLVHARRILRLWLILMAMGFSLSPALAQVDYSVHFEMEKTRYSLGEPIFCRFVIRNTGSKGFAFRYRTPTRALSTDYDQEPRFVVTTASGGRLPDPGPRPCGSPQGTTVYGYVTLPPGKTHTEPWLLNQWAQFAAPGTYHVRAERRLALLAVEGVTGKFTDKPAAFALAIDELTAVVVPSTPAEVKAAFQPYLQVVADPKNPNPAEAVVVLTSLPQAFFLDRLVAMASAAKPERWDRRDAVDGLARLNTPASWQAILKRFQSPDPGVAGSGGAGASDESPVQSYALLLLAEKGDPSFVPPCSQRWRRVRTPCAAISCARWDFSTTREPVRPSLTTCTRGR